ncbi:MAG: hypothetical protein Q7S86_00785 [bacterium]|nr:hypothetical protein [bacterium]
MIAKIEIGDITDPQNKRDIIIGMNTEMGEVSAIGRPFAKKVVPTALIEFGSVLTFQFDEKRLLHMIICHHLGHGGWRRADQYIRFGLDYLWQSPEVGNRPYSIVQIGSGPIGQRDKADQPAILNAMSNSFLPVVLYVRSENSSGAKTLVAEATAERPMTFLQGWSADSGVLAALN